MIEVSFVVVVVFLLGNCMASTFSLQTVTFPIVIGRWSVDPSSGLGGFIDYDRHFKTSANLTRILAISLEFGFCLGEKLQNLYLPLQVNETTGLEVFLLCGE